MSDIISVTGVVAAEPKHFVSAAGRAVTSFRLASAQRRLDRATGVWSDSGTNWYTVTAFNGLGMNAAASLHRGDRVVLRGRLRIRDWEKDGRTGTSADIIAESIGHDLLWGTTAFQRTAVAVARDALSAAGEEGAAWAASEPAEREPDAAQLVATPF